MDYVLVCEISKKQSYIFKSNKLAENIGASSIVKYITENLSNEYAKRYNGNPIYEGGGKSLYLFTDKSIANKFTADLSRKVIEYYPGVELFITGAEFDKRYHDIAKVIDKAYKNLAVKKSERKTNSRILSFGVNKRCASTNMPATEYTDRDQKKGLISSETRVKLKHKEGFKDLEVNGFMFPKASDDLGGNLSKKNYTAVVHIDGNKMGQRMDNFKNQNKLNPGENVEAYNEQYIVKLKRFSKSIKDAYLNSFKIMCEKVINDIPNLKEVLNLKENIIPIRPLIISGDDVCFVCDGRIGIDCSKIFIEALQKQPFEGESLKACAGIAIVKSHYPFSKAYELAEQLCSNAKSTIGSKDASLIDWHIEQGDISGSISEIREKHYKCYDGNTLNMRPIFIQSEDSWMNYKNFVQAMESVTNKDIARSKVKELREKLKEGKDPVKVFVESNKLGNIIDKLKGTNGEFGFSTGGVCMFYDAIESMDLYIQIKEA